MGLIKTDLEGYLKDPATNVIVSANFDKFKTLKLEQKKLKDLDKIKSDIDSLRSDLELIFNHLGITH